MIAVTFSLPQESAAFLRELRHVGRAGREPAEYLLGNLGTQEVLVLHAGVGDEIATKRAEALLAELRPECLIAAGFAGGLAPKLRAADLVVATNVGSPPLAARARALFAGQAGIFFGPVIGAPFPVESPGEKAELERVTGALAVDMETAALAGASARASVPFLAVRAISDAAGEALPVPFSACYDLDQQCPRPFALLRFLLRHPERLMPFVRFVRGLSPASAALRDFLLQFLAKPASSATPDDDFPQHPKL